MYNHASNDNNDNHISFSTTRVGLLQGFALSCDGRQRLALSEHNIPTKFSDRVENRNVLAIRASFRASGSGAIYSKRTSIAVHFLSSYGSAPINGICVQRDLRSRGRGHFMYPADCKNCSCNHNFFQSHV